MARITRQDADSLFEVLVKAASDAGVDSSNWTFGQHGGLSLTIYPTANGSPIGSCVGVWSLSRDAYHGMQGMIAAFRAVATR